MITLTKMTEVKESFVGHYRNQKGNIMIDVYERHISEDGIERETGNDFTICPLCHGLFTRTGLITHMTYKKGHKSKTKKLYHNYTYEQVQKEFPEIFNYFKTCTTTEKIRDRTRLKRWAYAVRVRSGFTQYELLVDNEDIIQDIRECGSLKAIFALVDTSPMGLYSAKEELETGIDETMKTYLRVKKE